MVALGFRCQAGNPAPNASTQGTVSGVRNAFGRSRTRNFRSDEAVLGATAQERKGPRA